MARLEWSQKYSIGVSEVDFQHQNMFGIINQLNDLVESSVYERPAIQNILDSLSDYARYHFTCEQELMQKILYPHAVQHKKAHDSFIIQLEKLYRSYENNEAVIPELVVFLYNWLGEHILIEDQKIGELVRSKK